MTSSSGTISDALSSYESVDRTIKVELSYSLVRLLSEQLYQSPLKAIEELVVNSYDADAKTCHISVSTTGESDHVVIYDDGKGMDHQGLADLWQIGHSNKRDEEIERRSQRKQIGKFGIGKLASHTIANQLTYITKTREQTLAVTIDFRDFEPAQAESSDESESLNPAVIAPVDLDVREIDKWSTISESIGPLFRSLGLTQTDLDNQETWTLAVLENLKEKGRNISIARLKWVLSTAMPRKSDFKLFLNEEEVVSSKLEHEVVTSFSVADLPEERLNELSKETDEQWCSEDGQLKTDTLFSEGISGNVDVTKETLTGGKSRDIGRSHGFFVRVRDRVINEEDPLFGLKPQVYDTFNRLNAQINADNLDKVLTAARDSLETTRITQAFQALLLHIFQEADTRYKRDLRKSPKGRKEGEKEIVEPRLVEFPLADAILTASHDHQGTEADESWFYVAMEPDIDLASLVKDLYTEPRRKYLYDYMRRGHNDRVVQFSPKDAKFWLNEAHEFVQENRKGEAQKLLEDFVTAEMLLEVYMRESHIPAHIIGNILEKRDKLLRSLARDRSFSFGRIAQALRDAANDEQELEINVVVAMRALGFTAKQISGSGEPDGIARYTEYPGGERKLTLEAKSSQGEPELSQLGFDALNEHKESHSADGCLLVSPSYPGETRGDDSAVARRAERQQISCWTVDQLAQFVESAEERHLNARNVISIVESNFSPAQVAEAINKQLSEPSWNNHLLYQGILTALKKLQGSLTDTPRSIDLIAGYVVQEEGLAKVGGEDVEKGIRDLAHSSQGGMRLDGKTVHILLALDELERRVAYLTRREENMPRRCSSFRKL